MVASISNRALFLEHIKDTPLTVNEIIRIFEVNANTARAWTKLEEVEKIPGSYPHAYRRKVALTPVPGAPAPAKAGENIVVLPYVPEEQVKAFFEKVMADEAPAFVFNDEFRSIDGAKSLKTLEQKLNTCLIVTQYYRKLMEKDGLL